MTHPLNTIAPYYTMYRLSFPQEVLSPAAPGQWVLDPFCGRGTTNFAARQLALPSLGIDVSPIAIAIAQAKLVSVAPADVVRLVVSLMAEEPADVPQGEFWERAFAPATLRDVCAVREGLMRVPESPEATALRAIMLGALHGPVGKTIRSYFSNQMPRTYATKPRGAVEFWRRNGLEPEDVPVADVVLRRASRAFDAVPPITPGRAMMDDARTVAIPEGFGPFDWVVTSPPYYGMRSYVSDQWLRNWFLGGPPEPDYSADRQLARFSPSEFAADLAAAWRNIAGYCRPGCRMVVRFGAVPSAPSDPEALLRESLALSNVGWNVDDVTQAGIAPRGRRQADQFGFVKSKPIEEVDVYATLGG